jgi:dienelactone hydrolase
MRATISLFAIIPVSLAQKGTKGNFPAKGDNGQTGGIFGMGGMSMSSMSKMGSGTGSLLATGSESPKGMASMGGAKGSTDSGSGAYPAHMISDPTLPGHTVYAPKLAPKDMKMPVIVWGNGGCISNGASFQVFLTEIASHGYLVLANGASGNEYSAKNTGKSGGKNAGKSSGGLGGIMSMFGSTTKVSDLTASIDWVEKGSAARYGDIDTTKIAAAGQSCGGLEAYSASYHEPRIKLTVLFNSGVLDQDKAYLLQELKAPVAYFLGGPKDIAYANVSFLFE